jgi:hypothetical protein
VYSKLEKIYESFRLFREVQAPHPMEWANPEYINQHINDVRSLSALADTEIALTVASYENINLRLESIGQILSSVESELNGLMLNTSYTDGSLVVQSVEGGLNLY